MTATTTELLDLGQLAALAGMSHSHVRALHAAGKLPPPRVLVGTKRVPGWTHGQAERWASAKRSERATRTTTTTTTGAMP